MFQLRFNSEHLQETLNYNAFKNSDVVLSAVKSMDDTMIILNV